MDLELTFRLARPNDFDEVLKLSEGIYDGHDYLPFRYHTWIKMENVAVMLAYNGEKLVGLLLRTVVDDGKTVIGRAGRTLRELRGQGINKRLFQAVDAFIRNRYPNASRQRFITLKSYDSYPTLTKLTQMDFLSSYAKQKVVRSHSFSTTNDFIQIEACTKEYLCDVIFSSPQAKKLFPDNVIIFDFFPMEPLRSNIDYWQQENELFFAVEKCSDGAFPRSISFGVLSPRVKCDHWSVTVYTSDPVLHEAHLLHQLKRACEVVKGDFSFDTLQDKSLTNFGRSVLQKRLQLELDEEMSEMSVKLYEARFLQQSHL
ncbi:hypothetical protein ACROYT_G035090 [Oculina patagonica]